MNRTLTACLLAGIFVLPAFAQQLTPGQQKYRALFQELVETNTQLSNGDCTALAQKIARHLKEAGFPDSDIHVFTAPNHPRQCCCWATWTLWKRVARIGPAIPSS
jgi:hypothetical protein